MRRQADSKRPAKSKKSGQKPPEHGGTGATQPLCAGFAEDVKVVFESAADIGLKREVLEFATSRYEQLVASSLLLS